MESLFDKDIIFIYFYLNNTCMHISINLKTLPFILTVFFSTLCQAQKKVSSLLNPLSELDSFLEDKEVKSRKIHMPQESGSIIYQFTSPMDSSLSKERIYRAALNWYYKNFPYGHSMLIQSDLREGQILARGEFQFPYSTLTEDLKMKIQYMIQISIRYGKYRIRFYDIEPQDQVLEENEYGKTYSHFEPRSLWIMYEQYQETTHPPSFMQEKIEGIHTYFQNLIQSFTKSMHSWTHSPVKQGF